MGREEDGSLPRVRIQQERLLLNERTISLGEMPVVREAPQDHVHRAGIHEAPDVEREEDGTLSRIRRAGGEKQGSFLEKPRLTW
jgi:hypothetical protein